MPRTLTAGLVLAVLVTLGPAAYADWQSDFDAGRAALAAGDLDRAETLLSRALKASSAASAPRNAHPVTAEKLAVVMRKTKRVKASAVLLEAALQSHAAAGTGQSFHAANLNNTLGVLYTHLGRAEDAEKRYLAAIAAADSLGGKAIAMRTMAQSNLAEIYRKRGAYDQAEPLLTAAIRAKEKALGKRHTDLVSPLVNLGLVQVETKRAKAARKTLKRAVTLARKADDDTRLATALHTLGSAYAALSSHRAAKKSFKEALALRERALGADHIDTAATVFNLANTLAASRKPKDAKPLYERALAARESAYGRNASIVADTLAAYLLTLQRLKDPSAAAIEARLATLRATDK